MALLEERKKKFAAEGLFDPERKRALPFWPQVVGIVTSPTGAVICDMLQIGFTERCPTRALLWPVRVQGETCGAEVAAAIRGFNAFSVEGPLPRPDLLIVARGGGSLEDLWGFNEEAVVRAAAESTIPLISAVGHETDWTLIDLVADARAPTPTKAAEWAVPKHSDLVLRLSECIDRARRCVRRHLEKLRAEFRGAERGLPRPHSLLAVPRQRLDTVGARLGQSLRHFSERSRARLEYQSVRLTPRHILLSLGALGGAPQSGARRRAKVLPGEHCQKTRAPGRSRSEAQSSPARRAAIRQRERLESLAVRSAQGAQNTLKRKAFELTSLSQLLRSLSHKSVLDRGFALVRGAGAKVIRRAAALEANAALDIEFADGHVSAHYFGPEQRQASLSRAEGTALRPAPDGPGEKGRRQPRQSTLRHRQHESNRAILRIWARGKDPLSRWRISGAEEWRLCPVRCDRRANPHRGASLLERARPGAVRERANLAPPPPRARAAQVALRQNIRHPGNAVGVIRDLSNAGRRF